MNRKVYAILISVPWSDAFETDEIPDATEAMDRFRDLLLRRFTDPEPEIWRFPRLRAVKDDVCDAFDKVRQLASGDDLFIVLFIGHGIPSDHANHAYEAWALNDKELSDHDLADRLAKLDPGVEVLVISDACYGAGIARAGSKGLSRVWSPVGDLVSAMLEEVRTKLHKWPFLARYRELKLKALADAWTPRALVRPARNPTDLATLNHMVCISAAAWNDQANLNQITKLIDKTIDAVDHDRTHGKLADTFYIESATGAAFQLQAFPNGRMCWPLLALQPVTTSNEEGSSMTTRPADLEGPTNIVLINYGKSDGFVTFILNNETVAVSEIYQKGQTSDSYGKDFDPATGTMTLKIPSEVVVGFGISNETTLKITPGSRINVITWRGKDPPVPPPPPRLARYQETMSFDVNFRALLGVAGAGSEQKADTMNGESTRPAAPATPPSYANAKPDQP